MGNLEEELDDLDFDYDPHGEDDWMSTRTLVGGPHDGIAFTWDSLTGLCLGTTCPKGIEGHVALVSYDVDGKVRSDVECRLCQKEEADG